MRGNTLRQLAVTGAIGLTAILTTIGIVVSLRHHRCGEPELLPIDGDTKALVEAIIRKQGEQNLQQRLECKIDYKKQSAGGPMEYWEFTEDFRYPSSLRYRSSVWGRVHPNGFSRSWVFEHLYSDGVELPVGKDGIKEPRPAPGAWLSFFFLSTNINPLLLRREELKLTMLGVKDVGDRETSGLRVEFPAEWDYPPRDYYFDRKTGQLLLMTTTISEGSGYFTHEEYHFKEFETYEGITLASRCVMKNGRDNSNFRILKVSFPSSFNDEPAAQ